MTIPHIFIYATIKAPQKKACTSNSSTPTRSIMTAYIPPNFDTVRCALIGLPDMFCMYSSAVEFRADHAMSFDADLDE